MKRINLLDENTSNKIAAGEVVERPSSVVKELVENSIDADSKNITIEIEDGGILLIRVIDDGNGIHKEDINKAFLPHATSKISTVEDIYSINTLGFRGEALPSIASVSKILLKSKQEDENFGKEIKIEGGELLETNEVGMNKGTFIEVRDLFYNVPARKKFLKTTSRETALINDIITRIALSNPNISFKLYSNGKKLIHTYGNGNLKDVIRNLYSKTISENIIYFESNGDELSLYGYIGKEEIARGSRNNQSIFVNGRYIKNKTIVAAVENAFKSFATVNKFPYFVLFVEVYPEFVDVNIHPTKAEIKFKDERLIFKRVFDCIHCSFKEAVFNTFSIKEEEEGYIYKDESKNISFEMAYKEPINEHKNHINMPLFDGIDDKKDIVNIPREVSSDDIQKEEEIYNKLRSLKEEKIINRDFNMPTKVEVPINLKNSKIENEESYSKNEVEVNTKERLPKFPKLRIIGQFNKTYILGEYDEVLYMIDQHAAHEKILFEKYLNNIESGSIVVQPLLIPNLIDLTLDDYSYYEENKEVFKNAGFKIENFGGNTLSLKEVPYFLGKLDAKNLFLEILDNLKGLGSGKTSEVKYNKIATMACKAAVKANDYLNNIEMEKLLNDLRYIDDPFHCPHGRPVIVKFTGYELDKKFRRII
ncbi:DNA mismatch repair endonuclease MutL [Clostridium septicum]|uniref:DNA mismatch repair protein MutL n=1 Tax=Clostridium septicum TaxID=1504 RepID=A0A9N7PKP2_CLOSE|nr:DNA mismatch repair endonuclease MutL [Clostridium septicum]AYE32972.1 DNA mismatch repair protein MutL [Clostridium septicum]MDU1314185.1 DNA mismatch repair endonuclease MutL [Clostridium septicum]QAS61160.1 DNA mismatch repair endonuclease MutL [Clostridium septicum]UEC19513.1 DNA mismatch repair endonuclease MutL [Clostridium septicum]USR99534.1 DNA mismatch repair endonuclease MutL [Clostridium septicum]